ncbi:DNA recombination/repair protein RecA [Vibrio fluvialis]|nr:DNA recombination/repair protein RecA [Vibrio fluvialis]
MSTKDAASAIDAIFGGEPETSGVNIWLDTGYPPLNKALSGTHDGGLPCGRIVQMYGDSSSGKTLIATSCMTAAQQQGGLALFMDHERSFMKHLAEQNGLNISKGYFSLQFPDSFEESITKSIKWAYYIRENKVIPDDAPLIVVYDSLASMVPKQKLDKEADELKMNDKLALAAACSSVFPALALHAEKTNCLMLFLDQIRQDPGIMFGDNTKTSGGKAPGFYASIRIALSRKVLKEGGEEYGQKITAKIVKNKVSRPFQKCEWDFLFKEDGTGYLDKVGGMVDYLCDLGVLKKSGAFIEFNGKKYNRKPLVELIYNNDLYDELLKLLPRSESHTEE